MRHSILPLTLLAVLLAGCGSDRSNGVSAAPPPPATPEAESKAGTEAAEDEKKPNATVDKAGEIVTQPARDVGIAPINTPPILEAAVVETYNLKGIKTCKQIAAAVLELNAVLGDDFGTGDAKKENRAGKLAEAGGQTVINSLIPFRALVREISGAAPAKRRLEAAIDAGYARRGFLRGVHQTRKCRTVI